MFFNKKSTKAKFDGWIKLHYSALYKHALWMTGNRDLASDMVQETYYKAWLVIGSLQDEKKIFPWLLTIMRRVIYREQRYQYRHQATIEYLQQWNEESTAPQEYSILDLYRSLESISHVQREAFLLHTLHGFTYEEISEQLEIPMGTVMSRISRAKAALQTFNNSGVDNVIPLQDLNRRGK